MPSSVASDSCKSDGIASNAVSAIRRARSFRTSGSVWRREARLEVV
jgi:hypothetical protein